MSMPSFPEGGFNITREQALNMILASIAMEEAALSHIINAEGEKIQYVLGTLKDQHGLCPSTQDILAVNKSVTGTLDAVMQNQVILKGKMERVLSECVSVEERSTQPECEIKRGRNNLALTGRYSNYCWKTNELLPWDCCSKLGNSIALNSCNSSLINLTPGRRYWGNFTIHVCVSPCISSITLSIKGLIHNCWKELITYNYCNKERCKCIAALSGKIFIPCQKEEGTVTQIALGISGPKNIYVEQAVLNISE